MMHVDQSEPCPPSLLAAATLKQAEEAEAYYDTWVTDQAAFVEFTRYKDNDVQQALRKMFNWKCA